MKIGYVLAQFPVLSQTFIINEIVELLQQGHDVQIISLSQPKTPVSHPEIEKYALLARTHYPLAFVKVEAKESESFDWLASLSSQLYGGQAPWNKLLAKLAEQTIIRRIAVLLQRLEVEVLHAHFYGLASGVAAMLSQQTGIPFTFTCHAADIFVNIDPQVLRKHIDAAFRVITISQYNQDYLQQQTGCQEQQIAVVRACAIMDKFANVQRNPQPWRILTVARLVEKKGIKYGLLAIRSLCHQFPQLSYHIIGDGPQRQELTEFADSLELHKQVKFLGKMASNHEFLQELAEGTIALLPCIQAKNGDQDGSPLTLQEAMWAQMPVVSTNIASVPELIEDEKEGLLVPPRDVEALARAIEKLLQDGEMREKLAKAGRKKVEKVFNIRQEVAKLIAVWEDAIVHEK